MGSDWSRQRRDSSCPLAQTGASPVSCRASSGVLTISKAGEDGGLGRIQLVRAQPQGRASFSSASAVGSRGAPRSHSGLEEALLPKTCSLSRYSTPSTSSKCSASCCGSAMPTTTTLPASSSSPPSPWGCPSTRRGRLVVGSGWGKQREELSKPHPALGRGLSGMLVE